MPNPTPAQLDHYGFVWSEVRLIIAAVALFLGGLPPAYFIFRSPALYGIISPLLSLAWLISGVVSIYLLYRWNQNRQMLFGGKNQQDMIAFFINAVSGLNLGFVGLTGRNVGMSISSNRTLFIIVGLIYLWAAYQLWTRWNAHGKKLF